jgi:DNA-binding MarR family transcriptional regulator
MRWRSSTHSASSVGKKNWIAKDKEPTEWPVAGRRDNCRPGRYQFRCRPSASSHANHSETPQPGRPSASSKSTSGRRIANGIGRVSTAGRADPGISNATLARKAFVTAQTMQAIVTDLERAGFILRHADPSHGRILRAGLTDHGHEALIQADQVVFDVESAMIRSLSDGEVATLINLLGRCGENLGSDE